MCGHATIALGRLLIDTHDESIFPLRSKLEFDSETSSTLVRLHAPCGIVRISVPTQFQPTQGNNMRAKSDPSKPVSFLSVPSFVAGMNLRIDIPAIMDWRSKAHDRSSITFDIAYGGAFYAIVSASELGFPDLKKRSVIDSEGKQIGLKYDPDDIRALDVATKTLKALIAVSHQEVMLHPLRELNTELKDIEFLYGIIVVDKDECFTISYPKEQKCKGSDSNLTFFGSQQLDRSPTGSGVSARMALSVAKDELQLGYSWVYHSVVSIGVLENGNEGAFLGTGVEKVEISNKSGIIVKVEGKSWYISTETFVVESGDSIGQKGFLL